MREIFTSKREVIIVDDDDFERASRHKWHITFFGYARTDCRDLGRRYGIPMHRFILQIPKGDTRVVDHINGNRLDNRKSNLRICTNAENLRNQKKRKDNTTGYKGVTFQADIGRFRARIRSNGKKKHLGCFDSAEEAHAAYCAAALELYGEFANFGDQTK